MDVILTIVIASNVLLLWLIGSAVSLIKDVLVDIDRDVREIRDAVIDTEKDEP